MRTTIVGAVGFRILGGPLPHWRRRKPKRRHQSVDVPNGAAVDTAANIRMPANHRPYLTRFWRVARLGPIRELAPSCNKANSASERSLAWRRRILSAVSFRESLVLL